MKKLKIGTEVIVYEDRKEIPDSILKLITAAEQAAAGAYAPYSRFQVGAALLLENGETVTGSNQENAVYPCGLCAERTAAFAASARYPNVPFMMLAITAINPDVPLSRPVSPCGSCRQALHEYQKRFGRPIEIILSGQTGPVYRFCSVEDLLPYTFDADFLP